ncbi:hypothetical protein SKAU_G00144880 [Synaphobranchus kaupii]|uniref:FAM13A-like domain-containing protein n=1 Tax=Synaphobranchus kaupii TaxID=118154 RepID=A0A9Q1J2H8_SYNKA|nr:hypothetical protein SKAU_G00144880 [Synaphobranchus kaupii]
MFCFCFQSSLLKLQALEVDMCSPLGGAPEDSIPAQGAKELSLPPSLSGEENSPAADSKPVQRAPFLEGGGGMDGQLSPGPSRLLHHITDGDIPLPSPRCASFSQSQRFNSDTEAAPSPPSSQQFIMARGIVRTEPAEGAKDTLSIPLLTKHIQTVKRKIRKFEEKFEQERKYRPSHNDKTANPEMFKLMNELAKSRKQLKDLKLKQSVHELRDERKALTEICRYNNDLQGATEPQHKPCLEETVDALLKRLREKRQALGLPDNTKEMTQNQMVLEKITLQKCLLYFESLHGRPGTKQERNLVKPLYDRYQMIKQLLCASPSITTIEEEDDSDEDCGPRRPALPCRAVSPADADEPPCPQGEDSDTAFVSPLDEVKAVRQPAITLSNLHEASRPELLECLRETRAEKRRRRKALREFEEQFFKQMGRTAQKDDRIPMAEEYHEYKNLKAKLRLLEVFLSKQETSKAI